MAPEKRSETILVSNLGLKNTTTLPLTAYPVCLRLSEVPGSAHALLRSFIFQLPSLTWLQYEQTVQVVRCESERSAKT